jgi:hypothetical protein
MQRALISAPHRFHVLGLDKPDIIEYFEPLNFGLKESWNGLRKEFDNHKRVLKRDRNRQDPLPGFKSWLHDQHGARINVESIGLAADSIAESPPHGLVEVLGACRRIGGPFWSDTPA